MSGELVKQSRVPMVHKEIDGIEMGVLADGTPYLTARGLSRLCGQAPSVIITLSGNWNEERRKPRGQKLAMLLAAHGYDEPELYIETLVEGRTFHAHPDSVCMAFLEYYAFEADSKTRAHAQHAYRLLARDSLRQFIYGRVGYDPKQLIPEPWRHFHDRLTLNALPAGYFSVFRETSDIVISAIQRGLVVDEHTVPDISVGMTWSNYWTAKSLEAEYGRRVKHPHVYPDYFPQKDVVDAYVYPLAALGEFRIWMQTEYLPKKFPAYLKMKVKQGVFPPSSVELLLDAVTPAEPEQLDA